VPRWVEVTGRSNRGFTLLELVVVMILVGILFSVAAWRLLPLRGDAEAAHVATTIGTLRSALGLSLADHVLRGQYQALQTLDGSNPMDLMLETPERYAGIVSGRDIGRVPPGHWYFIEESGLLGYRVRFPHYLLDSPADPVHLHWRVVMAFDASTDAAAPEQTSGPRPIGLRLVPQQTHPWPSPQGLEALQ